MALRSSIKDWGSGQPIVFSHGWPLSADDWDAQLLFFLGKGYRVIAHDRRGHGRSSQVGDGHDMDHYADDLAAVASHLDLQNAIHVGHSTGGGEVVHYLARHGESRVAKAAIISAVPPLMVRTAANPGGLPKETFDDFQAQLAANRSEFYRAVAAGPFYNYNRPGAKPSEAIIQNWWRQGMMGGAKAHYDGIVAFSQTDFTADLKKIALPVLVMHSEDDQIVPYADAGPLSAKLLKNGTLKTYKGFPARHADHGGRHHQRRPSGLHRELSDRMPEACEPYFSKSHLLSRRGFCLCCIGGAAAAAAGAWLTPRQAFAEARGIVSLIKDSAAVSPIVTHKLRGNISVLEGSGGNVAVLTGPDGKVLIDAGIARLAPAADQGSRGPRRRSDHAPDQHPLAFRPYRRQRLAQRGRRQDHRAGKHAQVSVPGPARRGLGLQFPRPAGRRNSQRSVRRASTVSSSTDRRSTSNITVRRTPTATSR